MSQSARTRMSAPSNLKGYTKWLASAGVLAAIGCSVPVYARPAAPLPSYAGQAVLAQDQDSDEGFITSSQQKPNFHTLSCLESLTRDCTISAAIETVLEERFGLERAKVLVGVARSQIALGNYDQAAKTLTVAFEEVTAANLPLVGQQQAIVIAPLMARAGDVATALALADEVRAPNLREGVYEAIVRGVLVSGLSDSEKAAGAKLALSHINNPVRRMWRTFDYYLVAPKEQITALELDSLEAQIADLSPAARYRALVLMRIVAERIGEAARAERMQASLDALPGGELAARQADAQNAVTELMALYRAGAGKAQLQAAFDALPSSVFRDFELVRQISPAEVALGRVEDVVARTERLATLEAKVAYLEKIEFSAPSKALSDTIAALLGEVNAVESALERDDLRLSLLEAALSAEDRALAVSLTRQMEDDDNQALALALLGPLV